jgi:hypothetical protein
MSQDPDRRLASAAGGLVGAGVVVAIESTSFHLATDAEAARPIAWVARCNRFVAGVVSLDEQAHATTRVGGSAG